MFPAGNMRLDRSSLADGARSAHDGQVTLDVVTFGLAYAGYLAVGLAAALHAWERTSRAAASVAAGIVTSHVALVYGHRFGWNLAIPFERNVIAFFLFNAAYLLIAAAPFLPRPWHGRLPLAAFPIVSMGAVGAAFRYEYLSVPRAPVLIAFLTTAVALISGWRARRRR